MNHPAPRPYGRRKLAALVRLIPVQVGAYVNDTPATEAEARAAFAALGWRVDAPEDAEQGIWLVYPDPRARGVLIRHGHFTRRAGNVDVFAEA